MLRIARHLALTGFVTSGALAVPSLNPAATRCSINEWSGALPRQMTYLLATATPDTALAGSGPVPYRIEWPPALRPRIRSVYGQIVRVERIGGGWSEELNRRLESNRAGAVLVPWAYGADCQPVLWPESFRWVEPGTVNFYVVHQRPRLQKYWVGGRPTFDVFFHAPYPHYYVLSAPDSFVTAEQLFDLFDTLPSSERLQTHPGDTVRIRRWLELHPDLKYRYPVSQIVANVFITVEETRVRAMLSPIRGTYRLTVSVPGGDSLPLLVRTEAHPSWAWMSPAPAESIGPYPRLRSERYSLSAYASRSESTLPESRARALNSPCHVHDIMVAETPVQVDGLETWRANLDWGIVQRCFHPHRASHLASSERWPLLQFNAHADLPGFFREHPDGRITFEQVIERDGRTVLAIRGERISSRVGFPKH